MWALRILMGRFVRSRTLDQTYFEALWFDVGLIEPSNGEMRQTLLCLGTTCSLPERSVLAAVSCKIFEI